MDANENKMFEGYGNQVLKASDFNWYCPDNGVSIEWIEERAVYLMENFINADSVYMSEDVHVQFMQSMMAKTRHATGSFNAGFNIAQIVTSAGPLIIKMVPGMCNFCHVGTNASYSDLIRIQVDEEFEKVFLKDCERE